MKSDPMQKEPTVIVPPDTMDEEFNLNWEEISSSIKAFPVEYTLTTRGDSVDEIDTMVCHRVKVQRYAYHLLPFICMHEISKLD